MTTITVRRTLLVLLVSFGLVPLALVAIAGSLVTDRMTDRLVERHNRTLAEQARSRAEGLFDTAEALASVLARSEAFAGLGPDDRLTDARRVELERSFRSLLEVHGEFLNVFFATDEDEFLMVGHRDRRLQVRQTVRGEDGALRSFWADSVGGEARPEPDPFRATKRPWFEAGRAGDGRTVWSNPYVFASSRKVGVTASHPIANPAGEPIGVLGVDLSLDDLSAYLARFRLGEKGTAFALTLGGDVVAWAEEERVIAIDSESRPVLAQVQALEDDRFHPDLARGVPEGEGALVHEADGETYFTQLVPFHRGPLAWSIGVTAPRSQFTAGLGFLRLYTAGIAIAAGAAAFLLALLVSVRITRPIETLVQRAGRVRGGDLQSARVDGRVATPLLEIRELDQSFDEMVDGLHELFVTRRYISGATRAMIAERTGQEISELATRGTKTEATVIFSDVRGFTTFSEKHPPEAVIEVLNHYLSMQSDAIHAHGGVVDKFIGDEVMALFLGPGRERDAVRTAVEIQRAIATMNRTRRAAGQESVEVGIGIHSGAVLMGDIGSETRMDYSAIGDVVNVASRLQHLARGGQVVVSGTVAAALGDDFGTETVEEIQVKGREATVRVYRVQV